MHWRSCSRLGAALIGLSLSFLERPTDAKGAASLSQVVPARQNAGVNGLWLSRDGSLLLINSPSEPDDEGYTRAWDTVERQEIDLTPILPGKAEYKAHLLAVSRDGSQWLTKQTFVYGGTYPRRYTIWKRTGRGQLKRWQQKEVFLSPYPEVDPLDVRFVGDALMMLIKASVEVHRSGHLVRRVALRARPIADYAGYQGVLSPDGSRAVVSTLKDGEQDKERSGLGVFNTNSGSSVCYLAGSENYDGVELSFSPLGRVVNYFTVRYPFSAEAAANSEFYFGPINWCWDARTGRFLEESTEPWLGFWPHSNSTLRAKPWRLRDPLTQHDTPLPSVWTQLRPTPFEGGALPDSLCVSEDGRQMAWSDSKNKIQVKTLR